MNSRKNQEKRIKTMIKRHKKKVGEEKSKTKTEQDKLHRKLNNTGAQWKESMKYVHRTFPGPAKVIVPLRVAIDRGAFVNMTNHVMKAIDEEVCGVMVGETCEDDEGFFVHVRNIIKGSAAHQGEAHVTFTHDTWNQIHSQLENDFPDYDILGWYHSHPGFGVSFSEMDLFIQRNFFPSPTQFALVMDPLGGEKALCVNTSEGVQYINKFWVDGREYLAFQGGRERSGSTEYSTNNHIEESLGMIERRLSQVLHALDKLSINIYRALTVMGALFLGMLIAVVFYSVFLNSSKYSQPPEVLQYVPVPVKIKDNEVLLGIGIIDWKIPPEVSAYFDRKGEESGGKTGKGWFQSIIDHIDRIVRLFKIEPAKDQERKNPGPPESETMNNSSSKKYESNLKKRKKNNDINKQ
jgi:proteasome lid subunit RPN8/RPN11